MTILHVGSEIGAFVPLDGNCIESTDPSDADWDSSFARCALTVQGPVSGASTPAFSSAADFHMHAVWSLKQSSVDVYAFNFRSGSTDVLVAKQTSTEPTNPTGLEFFTLQGGTLTSVGTVTGLDLETRHTWDINLVAGASGSLTVRLNGTERLTGTGLDHSGFAGVTKWLPRGARVAIGYASWSECIASTTHMVGRRVKTIPPTGNGANTAWIGTFAGVDEIAYADADGLVSTAANDKETFTHSTTVTGTIEAFAITARANCGTTGPQNLKGVVRIGGVDYESTNTVALTAGMQACTFIWETSPATGVAWTASEINSLEFGVKAIA